METIISLALIVLLGYFITKDKRSKKDYEEIKRYKYNKQTKQFDDSSATSEALESPEQTHTTDYKKSYQARNLLTANEYHAYKKLKAQADERDLMVCPKVRLADIIEPHHNATNYMALFGKIKSKHVDFVICDQRMIVLGVIELDDRSHDTAKRKERDRFVDDILTAVGYKIIHTREISPNILDIFSRKEP